MKLNFWQIVGIVLILSYLVWALFLKKPAEPTRPVAPSTPPGGAATEPASQS